MDKKRVFNAAVTAGLSLSMVLTSVPATALAQTDMGASAITQAAETVDIAIVTKDSTQTLACPKDGSLGSTVAAVDLTGIKSFTWTDSNGGIHEFAASALASYIFTESCTLTAVYDEVPEDTIEVTLDMNYPDGSDAQVVATADENGKISAPADPACEGFDFVGWAVNGNTDNMVTSGVAGDMVYTADTTLVAQWVEAPKATAKITYQVTNPADGSYYEIETTADQAGHVAQPADPSAEGFDFVGWAVNGDTDNVFTSGAISSVAWDEDTTFVALWNSIDEVPEDTIEVTLDMNYPDGSDAQVVATADENGKISAPADPACEGFDFVGWAVNGNTDNMVTSGVAGDMVYTADTTLVAQWVEAPKATAKITYQVTNPADGSYYEIETTADQAGHVAQPADPSAEGFDFVGWAVNGDTDNVFTSGAISSVAWDEDTTFVALWAPASEDSVTLTYKVSNPADGSYYEIQATVDEDGHVAKPADPAAEGYEFVGWAIEGTTNIFTSGAIETLTWEKDTTFVAQWAPVADEAPTVTYNVTNPSDGSSYQIVATVDSTGHVSKPADPADEGYVFVGWKMDGTEDVYTSGAISFLTWDEDVSFTAQWVAEPVEEESVEITYDLNFPDGSDAQVVATANEDGFVARPADPTCTGWKFIGWKCINPAGDDLLTSDDVASISWSSDQLLQAQWEKVADPVAETHTVTFDYCLTNTNDLLVEVEDGQPVARPADPTCAGYVFTGWYSDVDRTQLWDFSTPVTSDMTLYANWAEAETPSDPVVPGDDTATPETPQESEEAKAEEAKSEVPETGDATNAVAVTGIGIAGLMAAAASFILRRRNEQ